MVPSAAALRLVKLSKSAQILLKRTWLDHAAALPLVAEQRNAEGNLDRK